MGYSKSMLQNITLLVLNCDNYLVHYVNIIK